MNFNRFFFDGCIHFTAISGQMRFNNKRKLPPVISKKGVKLGSVGKGVRFKVGVNLRTVNHFSSVFNVLQGIRFFWEFWTVLRIESQNYNRTYCICEALRAFSFRLYHWYVSQFTP